MKLFDPTTNQWYETDASGSVKPTAQTTTPTQVDMSGKATDIAAQLLAAQYQNWQDQFKPVELSLISQSSLNNPDVLTNAVKQAGTTANQAYDTMAGVEQRQLAARGITPNSQQSDVSNRLRNLSRGAAVAGAENTARQNVATQDELIALGTAPNPNIVQGTSNSNFAGA